MFLTLLAPLLSKAALAQLLKEAVKAKVLQELHEVAQDPRNQVTPELVKELDTVWDDLFEAVAAGLKR